MEVHDSAIRATHQGDAAVAAEDVMRADLYQFLGGILARPPDSQLLGGIAGLTSDSSPLGQAMSTLSRLAGTVTEASAKSEFNALFIGLGRGELLPFCSYYLTGFLNEKPLADLRRDLSDLGIERAKGVFEPEDNMACLCEVMGCLIVGKFGPPLSIARQRDFFSRHIEPWGEHFFSDLERAKNAVLYAPVGTIGRHFMQLEQQAFRMAAA